MQDVCFTHVLFGFVRCYAQFEPVVTVYSTPLKTSLSAFHIDDTVEVIKVFFNHLIEGDGRDDLGHPIDYKTDEDAHERH